MDMINETGKGVKTKYRLAQSIKECMKIMSVDNITVKQITENCGVTRQTIYRNFMVRLPPGMAAMTRLMWTACMQVRN